MSIDHPVDHGRDQFIERRCGVLDKFTFDHAINFLDVPLVQHNEDRAFVREVLVNCSSYSQHPDHPPGELFDTYRTI